MNPIHQLLDEVLETGRPPTADAINAAVTRGPTVRDKQAARDTIRRTAAKIVNAMDSGLADQGANLAAATAEELAAYTHGGHEAPTSRDLAAAVPRSRKYAAQTPANSANIATRELGDLLGSRIRTGLTTTDLDKIELRDDLTAAERADWRSEATAAAEKIRTVYAAGQQGVARRLVAEYADTLSQAVATPERRDPHEDTTDPRELADLVPRTRGHN